jgi:hypothetical protein
MPSPRRLARNVWPATGEAGPRIVIARIARVRASRSGSERRGAYRLAKHLPRPQTQAYLQGILGDLLLTQREVLSAGPTGKPVPSRAVGHVGRGLRCAAVGGRPTPTPATWDSDVACDSQPAKRDAGRPNDEPSGSSAVCAIVIVGRSEQWRSDAGTSSRSVSRPAPPR